MVLERIAGRGLVGALVCLGIACACSLSSAQAQEYASKERARAAKGYYARARAMCVESLEEFEQGRKFARPDLLVDPEEWRLTMVSLCEQLNRLIDPKPLVTNNGVVFQADPRMVRREHDRLPPVVDGVQDSSAYGESERMKEIQEARAKMYEPKKVKGKKLSAKARRARKAERAAKEDAFEQVPEGEEQAVERAPEQAKEPKEPVEQPEDEETPPSEVATDKERPEKRAAPAEETPPAEEAAKPVEDGKTSEAIENMVRERLKSLESAPAPEEGAAAPKQPQPAGEDDFE